MKRVLLIAAAVALTAGGVQALAALDSPEPKPAASTAAKKPDAAKKKRQHAKHVRIVKGPRGKRGRRGARGPAGPRGAVGPAGPVAPPPPPPPPLGNPVAFSVAANTPMTEVISGLSGIVVEASCDPGGNLSARIRTTEADGSLGIGVFRQSGLSDSELVKRLDQGQVVALDLGHSDVSTVTFNYSKHAVTAARLTLADGGGLPGDADCAIWGVYEDI